MVEDGFPYIGLRLCQHISACVSTRRPCASRRRSLQSLGLMIGSRSAAWCMAFCRTEGRWVKVRGAEPGQVVGDAYVGKRCGSECERLNGRELN